MVELLDIQVNRLHKLEGQGRLKGFADLLIGGAFLVKGLRILEGKNGLFVGMPAQKGKNGQWYNAAFPITKEMYQQITQIVLEEYHK